MIRQFSLQNEYAQEYPLSLPGNAFLDNPTGLGYSLDVSYRLIGNSWVRNYVRDKQTAIKGEVVFLPGTPYNTEADFLRFVRASKRLAIVYTTTAGTWMKDVDLTAYEKGEISEGGVLKCKVTLTPRSLWYSRNRQSYSINVNAPADAMTFDFSWPATFQAIVDGTIELTNDGSVPAPITVTWHGPIVNPVLQLIVDGEETARCKITGEATSGQTINYSSRDGDLYIYKDAAGVQTNLINSLDINNNNFFKIPVGNSELRFSADAQITEPIAISVYKLYRAT